MKRVLLLFLILGFLSFTLYSQTLSKSVIQDFANSFYYKQRIEKNEGLSTWAYLAGQNLGYGRVETLIAIEQLEQNYRFREQLFKVIFQLCKCDQEFLALQFISMGMHASNGKSLALYVLKKYKPEENLSMKETVLDSLQQGKIIDETFAISVDSIRRDTVGNFKKLKAKMSRHPSDKLSSTKTYCDSSWKFIVSIRGSEVTIKKYAAQFNKYYKDKINPIENIMGVLLNDAIVIKGEEKSNTPSFKVIGNLFYELNVEETYNEYNECK